MAYAEFENKGGQKMKEIQTKQDVINIAERLCENAKGIRYGSVSATLKINNGRVVDVTHSLTESMREKGENK